MQEEVEMRAVTLAISTSKLSGRLLKAAIAKVMKEANKPRDKSKDKSPTVKHGKQSLKELNSIKLSVFFLMRIGVLNPISD